MGHAGMTEGQQKVVAGLCRGLSLNSAWQLAHPGSNHHSSVSKALVSREVRDALRQHLATGKTFYGFALVRGIKRILAKTEAQDIEQIQW